MRHKTSVLVGMFTLCCFPAHAANNDVPSTHWAAPAVKSVTHKKLMTADADGKFHGERPVTRYELAVVLDRFVRYMEQGRKPLSPSKPVPVPQAKVMSPTLTHLIGNGFLPVGTPLRVKDGTRPVTAQETADAMAQVVAQLSSRALPPVQH